MYVPTSLWESTRHLEFQIFEAMDVEELKGFMRTPFSKEKVRMAPYSYVMQEFSFENEFYYERKKNDDTVMNSKLKCSNLDLALTPQIVEDCS
jgi:hypothetical protein